MEINQASQIALELTQLWASKGAVTVLKNGITEEVANTPEDFAKAYSTFFETVKELKSNPVR